MTAETIRTIPLAEDQRATLIQRPAATPGATAVLYLHGYVDYFFQDHLAAFFTDQGMDFYAIELRRYGRSLREDDVPFNVHDLGTYDEELDAAVAMMQADGVREIVMMAHSTGGLIAPLWLHRHRHEAFPVAGLILNSPWLELHANWWTRTMVTWLVRQVARFRPDRVIADNGIIAYGESLLADHHDEWTYDLRMKPLGGSPVRAGWMTAVRNGHAELHRGLNLRIPILLLRSDTSLLGQREWSAAMQSADTVLDVAQMHQWAHALGNDVEEVVIENGMHDLTLSAAEPRAATFRAIQTWLDAHALLPGLP